MIGEKLCVSSELRDCCLFLLKKLKCYYYYS